MSQEPNVSAGDVTAPAHDTLSDDLECGSGWRESGWMRIVIAAISSIVVVALLGLVASIIFSNEPPELATNGLGAVADPPRPIADFALTDQHGNTVNFSDFRGKPVLLFFGYTHCPDVCPTTLGEFRFIRTRLGEDADRVHFVFISVDGTRDTPEVLAAYLNMFEGSFVGLTGPEDVVAQIGQQFSVFFEISGATGTPSAAGYFVDHTAYTYLIDAEGQLIVTYPFSADPSGIAGDIRTVLERET